MYFPEHDDDDGDWRLVMLVGLGVVMVMIEYSLINCRIIALLHVAVSVTFTLVVTSQTGTKLLMQINQTH
jgi:hypothetical protein